MVQFSRYPLLKRVCLLLQACCKHLTTLIQVTLAEVMGDAEICCLGEESGHLSPPSIIASWVGKHLNVCSHIFEFLIVPLFSPFHTLLYGQKFCPYFTLSST